LASFVLIKQPKSMYSYHHICAFIFGLISKASGFEFHQPVLVSGSALHPTPAQGILHDIFSDTCVTNTNPYNYSRQSISKPLALEISPKIKAQIW
jgi:hypothetical protein